MDGIFPQPPMITSRPNLLKTKKNVCGGGGGSVIDSEIKVITFNYRRGGGELINFFNASLPSPSSPHNVLLTICENTVRKGGGGDLDQKSI